MTVLKTTRHFSYGFPSQLLSHFFVLICTDQISKHSITQNLFFLIFHFSLCQVFFEKVGLPIQFAFEYRVFNSTFRSKPVGFFS